jgi:hypothetical protein
MKRAAWPCSADASSVLDRLSWLATTSAALPPSQPSSVHASGPDMLSHADALAGTHSKSSARPGAEGSTIASRTLARMLQALAM